MGLSTDRELVQRREHGHERLASYRAGKYAMSCLFHLESDATLEVYPSPPGFAAHKFSDAKEALSIQNRSLCHHGLGRSRYQGQLAQIWRRRPAVSLAEVCKVLTGWESQSEGL